MPTLAALKEERKAKEDQLAAIFAKYPEITDMPAEEAKEIKPRNDELTALAKSIEEAEEREGIRAGILGSIAGRKGEGRPEHMQNGREDAVSVKSFGEILRESKSYEAFRQGSVKTAVIELGEAEAKYLMGDAETKTLMTLSTINNPATRLPGIRPSAQEERTVGDLMLPGTTDNNAITYMEETTFTNNAAETAEGNAKPESALAFTERTDNVRKIATWIPATSELLADVRGIQSYIEGRLSFMVKRREELQLLVGDGTAPNISGILDRSGIQTQAKGTDPAPDAVYKAMTKIRSTAFAEPDAAAFHPNDWQDIRLLRTADGIYIWGSPADAGPERIWGLPVRITSALTENTGLVGAFKPFSQIFRREGITITISTEHSTYFTENKVAILAEERLALAVYRPAAFCTVTSI